YRAELDLLREVEAQDQDGQSTAGGPARENGFPYGATDEPDESPSQSAAEPTADHASAARTEPGVAGGPDVLFETPADSPRNQAPRDHRSRAGAGLSHRRHDNLNHPRRGLTDRIREQ